MSQGLWYLYYKRVDPYICSALAPVLEGSGSRRLYQRKGTSVDRVSVVLFARVDRRIFFLLFVKNGFMVGARMLNVTEGQTVETTPSAAMSTHHCLSATHWTAVCSQTERGMEGARKDGGWAGGSKTRVGGREGGNKGGREVGREGWREGGEGGREGGREG